MSRNPSTHPAVWVSSVAVAVIALCGIVLMLAGKHHALAASLIGLAVVTQWVPITLRRKLDA